MNIEHIQPEPEHQQSSPKLKHIQSISNGNYSKPFPYNTFKRSNTLNNETIHEARPGIGARRASAGSMLKHRTGSSIRRASSGVHWEKMRHRSEKKKTRWKLLEYLRGHMNTPRENYDWSYPKFNRLNCHQICYKKTMKYLKFPHIICQILKSFLLFLSHLIKNFDPLGKISENG